MGTLLRICDDEGICPATVQYGPSYSGPSSGWVRTFGTWERGRVLSHNYAAMGRSVDSETHQPLDRIVMAEPGEIAVPPAASIFYASRQFWVVPGVPIQTWAPPSGIWHHERIVPR